MKNIITEELEKIEQILLRYIGGDSIKIVDDDVFSTRSEFMIKEFITKDDDIVKELLEKHTIPQIR